MKNESEEFQRGYNEAMSVFEAGFHPGYCQNSEQAVRVTRSMLKAGLSGKEAQSQRSTFITADRQKNQIGGAVQGALSVGNGHIIRPSAEEDGLENIDEVYERRRLELAKSSTNDGQDKSKDKAVEWTVVSPQN